MTIVTMMEQKECVEIDQVEFGGQFEFGHIWRIAKDVKLFVDGHNFVAVSPTFQRLNRVVEHSLCGI